MSKFSVNEIVEGVGLVTSIQCNGMEGTIVEGLRTYMIGFRYLPSGNTPIIPKEKLGYRVAWQNGETGIVSEINLRKRKPPREDTCQWSEIKDKNGNEIFNPLVVV